LNPLYHILAILTSALWGTTFISSKVLLNYGLSPAEIMMLRFALAYLCLLPFKRGRWLCDSWRDEAQMMLLGITGGSAYFLLENTALLYTQASNVGIIIAVTPLLTTLTIHLVSRQESVPRSLYRYSLLSLAGVALVVFNGEFVLRLNPLGDILTLGAAVMWVIYSIIVLRMQSRYSSLMITRKVFFYGVLTLLPYFAVEPFDISWDMLSQGVVAGNLLYLGIVASLLCYWTWNVVIDKLGAVRATNYLYVNPIVALLASWAILDERITALALVGAVLILLGVYLAERRR